MVRACWRGRGSTEAGESSRRWRTGSRGWCAPVGWAVAGLRLEKVPGGGGQASEGGARLLAGPWQDRLEKVPGGGGQASEGGARLSAGPWQD